MIKFSDSKWIWKIYYLGMYFGSLFCDDIDALHGKYSDHNGIRKQVENIAYL